MCISCVGCRDRGVQGPVMVTQETQVQAHKGNEAGKKRETFVDEFHVSKFMVRGGRREIY